MQQYGSWTGGTCFHVDSHPQWLMATVLDGAAPVTNQLVFFPVDHDMVQYRQRGINLEMRMYVCNQLPESQRHSEIRTSEWIVLQLVKLVNHRISQLEENLELVLSNSFIQDQEWDKNKGRIRTRFAQTCSGAVRPCMWLHIYRAKDDTCNLIHTKLASIPLS